jgi:Cft2 family RNA processing exonuclease
MKGVVVEAKIHHYTHFSGHADEKDLLQWYRSLPKAPKMMLCIVHGVRKGSSQGFRNTMNRRRIDVSRVKIPELREEVIVF